MRLKHSILIISLFYNTYSFCGSSTHKEVDKIHNKLHITKQEPYNFSYTEYSAYLLNLGGRQVNLQGLMALTIDQWNSQTFEQCLEEVSCFVNMLPDKDKNFKDNVKNLKAAFETSKNTPHVAIARIVAVLKNATDEVTLNSLPLPYVFLSALTFDNANNRLSDQNKMPESMRQHVRCIGSFKKDGKQIQSIPQEWQTIYPYAHSETAIGICSLIDDTYKISNICSQIQPGYKLIGYIMQIKTCLDMCYYCQYFWSNKCYINENAVISSTTSTGELVDVQKRINALNVNKYSGRIYGY